MAWASSTRRARLPKDWSRRRIRVERRAGGRCECTGCEPFGSNDTRPAHEGRCGTRGSECDHVIAGDDHRVENLQWLCSTCHRRKTLREREAARPQLKKRAIPHPGLTQPPQEPQP